MKTHLQDPIHILLVDDDEDDYLLTKSLLRDGFFAREAISSAQFTLDWVNTYEACLQALEQQAHDVYLIDYRLGLNNGVELLREATARGCTAPMILLTGKGGYAVDLDAMQAGATDFLTKDELTAPLLERTIRYSIERKRTELAMQLAQDELELRVVARTRELAQANLELRAEIQERQKVEATLEAERKRLFSLLEVLPAIVYLQAPDYTLRFANGRFKEHYGDPTGKTCYWLLHRHDFPCQDCMILNVFSENTPLEWEKVTPEGRVFQTYDYPFVDADGSPLVMVLSIDITRRKQVEAQLDQNNQELRALSRAERAQRHLAEAQAAAAIALNTSLSLEDVLDRILEQIQSVVPCRGMAIMMMDGDHVVFARHRGFEDLPESWDILKARIPIDAVPQLRSMYETGHPILLNDVPHQSGWQNLTGFGWVNSYAASPLKSKGKIIGFLNVLSDQPNFGDPEILQRLQAFTAHAEVAIQNAHLYNELQNALNQEQAIRAQLIHAEKFSAMGRIVASVAHELNNPLQTIKNCLFLAEQEVAPGSASRTYLDIATMEIQRLAKLVTQLRELYRPRKTFQMQPMELLTLLDEVHSLLAAHLRDHNVSWDQAYGNVGIFPIKGIADQLKQVFINIITNAVEAMQPAGGVLKVEPVLLHERQEIGIAFTDTGPGIVEENLNNLFEPFFTTKPHGSGLGLSISFEIMERHAGRISVESKPGQGATFTIWLPRFTGDDMPDRLKGN